MARCVLQAFFASKSSKSNPVTCRPYKHTIYTVTSCGRHALLRRRLMKERSSDASETERLLNVKPKVILGSLTAGYVISDDCQTSWLHNTGTTPNLGAPLDTNQHELQNITNNTKRQTRFRNNTNIQKTMPIQVTWGVMQWCTTWPLLLL